MPDLQPEDLMGVWECAQFLGVTLQNVHQRRKDGRFPDPFAYLRMGPIWLRSEIEPLRKKKKVPKGVSREARSPESKRTDSAVSSPSSVERDAEG